MTFVASQTVAFVDSNDSPCIQIESYGEAERLGDYYRSSPH